VGTGETGEAITFDGSGVGVGAATGKLIVFVKTGAMLVLGACIVVTAGSLFQNFLTNHTTAVRAAIPPPLNTHCLFWTIQFHIHIAGLL
jgi:hypothetical protein